MATQSSLELVPVPPEVAAAALFADSTGVKTTPEVKAKPATATSIPAAPKAPTVPTPTPATNAVANAAAPAAKVQAVASGPNAVRKSSQSSPTQILRNSTQYAVLVVSRRPEVVANVEDLLLKAGESVFVAKDLRNAWDNIKLGRIGLVVLDCCQPGHDELTLLSTVRALPATADVSFLFLKNPGVAIPNLPLEGDDRTHDSWLDYPCTLQNISVSVTRLLQQRAYSRRLKAQQAPASGSSGKMAATDSNLQASVSAAFPGMFNGRLGELDVPKLLAMLAPMNMTGILTVKSGNKRKGQIHLVNGAVWHATFQGSNGVQGSDALFIIFRMKDGKFTFDTAEPPSQRTIQGNTMGLLLESMRDSDETQALVQQAKKAESRG
jgi:CheY-like chemotaxis protein